MVLQCYTNSLYSFLVVKAYQYTSLTSVMLLDCWAIPAVIFLTWMFLKTNYRFRKYSGVAICVSGLVLVVFSDVHAGDRAGNSSVISIIYVFVVSFLLHLPQKSAIKPFVLQTIYNYGNKMNLEFTLAKITSLFSEVRSKDYSTV